MHFGGSDSRLLLLVVTIGLFFRALALPSQAVAKSALAVDTSVNLIRRGGCCGKPLASGDLSNALDQSSTTLANNDRTVVIDQGYLSSAPGSHADLESTINPGVSYDQSIPGSTFPGPQDFLHPQQWSLTEIQRTKGPGGIDEIWRGALQQGQAMRQILDKYVGSHTRRIDDPSTGPPPVKIDDQYALECEYIESFTKEFDRDGHISELYDLVGVQRAGVQRLDAYYECSVQTKHERFGGTILDVYFNIELGIAVIPSMKAYNDDEDDPKRLFSSELLWQLWEKNARADALKFGRDPDAAVRSLQWIVQHNVVNSLSDTMMRLAHLASPDVTNPDGSKTVDDMPPTMLGWKGHLGLDAGQGKFQQGNPLFDYLVAIPNVRPTAHMLSDHNPELDRPYIDTIHTFPRRRTTEDDPSFGVRPEYDRIGTIIIQLGSAPTGLRGRGADGTVETS